MTTTGEFALIDWIRRQAPLTGRVRLGIGDDCAVLSAPHDNDLLVTTDMLLEGRHFRLNEATAEDVGFKALAVNLSDIAAMAGVPTAAFVAVALPRGQAVEIAQGIYRGIAPLAARFGVTLAGGDTNAWDGPLVVSVTLLGEATPPGPVARAGAHVGDAILVTGPLGGSLRGRHLRPQPRVAEALVLHAAADLHAMIDLSDGLSSDLAHILAESGALGATLDAARVPIHADAIALAAADGRSPLDHALHDGEDFELCCAVTIDDAERLLARPPDGLTLHLVGRFEATPGLRLRSDDGRIEPFSSRGFDHLAPGWRS
jgi:thiamine-monophosphate kinase